MGSIPKGKEIGVPHFTEDNLQRIIINPFYAISIAPQLTEEHEPAMGKTEWVQANTSLLGRWEQRGGSGSCWTYSTATS